MNLLIGGDLVPTESNIDLFNNADIELLLGKELINIWGICDIKIFNLETPLTDEENCIHKYGPNLIAPISSINGIRALSPSLVTLANNHILDQGEEGLRATENVLKQNSIPFIGVGQDLTNMIKFHIIEKDGVKIGVYACAEHEFTVATENSAGANPFDPLTTLDDICNLKQECDYLIVLYHGGKEEYRYPSPYLQKVCRRIVDKGADIVICQHSHCIGCMEQYNESHIVYGQGNFIFDACDNEFWNTSLLIKIEVEEKLNIEYIPIVKKENCIRLATEEMKRNILADFNKRSDEILQKGLIEEKYNEFAKNKIQFYLRSFCGFGKWLSRIDRHLLRGRLLRKLYNNNQILKIQNFIECEAHRELVLMGLKGENNSGTKKSYK
ncbi:CapA family protein [Clostridium botulinum]|uniref:Poly-gamma-glutamate biosynthesis protein n=1 Tax=Clostridium botulinum TaxID=1491 RepID=A0A9Q1ZBG6_CLOBO|nr:CapA family protein [Clostridium botulinum]AEB75394.1 putative poly-gamma-glutamate synthesis protein [Clostridium botulinum BKT015925]KEH99911.1 poly-gamma-glutamate biosynthesis protein [Clostridium botulinum D str. 16868]KEI03769.1 poly-gamma-glutamate biosynthesis protein [Clostridium botulinum C/D str. Sp77]KLU76358.1 poly-gamma-glutamate biosynthesis protein [Clostridium botulinum V891]KOA73638.1 poly-gamma-glutamate biosynthesis protein [Clostridium botulinum]